MLPPLTTGFEVPASDYRAEMSRRLFGVGKERQPGGHVGAAPADVYSLLLLIVMCAGSGLWFWFVLVLARRDGAPRTRRVPLTAHRAAPPRVGRAFAHFARVINARLNQARARATKRPRPRPPHCCRPRPRRVLAHDTRAPRRHQQLPRAVRLPLRRAHQRPLASALRRLNVNSVFARPAAGSAAPTTPRRRYRSAARRNCLVL